MPYMTLVKLTRFGLILTALALSGCPAPGPNRPDGERRGPPPFSQLDLNGDGQMTLEEFKSHKIPRGDHAEVFKNIDANGDGVVTESEFTSHRPPSRPSQPDQN
jgi:hypothetical protein